jgi:hypothetical protein
MVGGWAGRLPARGWDKGSRRQESLTSGEGGGGLHQKKTHFWKLIKTQKNTVLQSSAKYRSVLLGVQDTTSRQRIYKHLLCGTRNFLKEISRRKKNWSQVPDGSVTPGQTGRLTVGRKLTATATKHR